MARRSRVVLVAHVLCALALAGCVSEDTWGINFTDRNPVFDVLHLDAGFEGEFIWVNLTIVNRAKAPTPAPETPSITFFDNLNYYIYNSSRPDPRPGGRLGLYESSTIISRVYAWTSSQGDEPPEPIYYDDYVKHVKNRTQGVPWEVMKDGVAFRFEPGVPKTVRFLYGEKEPPWGGEVYYAFEVNIMAAHPDGRQGFRHHFSGCFNEEVEEYYGLREEGPDCYYANSRGELYR
jgi:hypothetical protein